MGGQLTYLYSDGTRYWYDTRPTVNKLALDRAQSFKLGEAHEELLTRLRKVSKPRDFAAYHVAPASTGDVLDEDRVRVIVLHPEATHKRRAAESEAVKSASLFLESRGTAQRLYKKMLVFIAADEGDAEALLNGVRDYLAWSSINNERNELNLDAQQRRQVADSLKKANETVDLRLKGSYNWLLVPIQPEPLGPIEMQANKISGDDNFYERAARRVTNDGLLIKQWSPDILKMELDRYIWGEEKGWTVGLKQLWEYLAQYCYLPRLFDHQVLVQAVQSGVGRLDAPFAYSTGMDAEGFPAGLVYKSLGSIFFDEQSLLIHPDHVRQRPVAEPTPVPPIEPDGNGEKPNGDSRGEPPPEKKLTRFYGSVLLDSQRVNKEVGLVVEEVVQQLTSLVGCEVALSLEIEAKKTDGFEDQTVRTVSENSRTLKFEQHEFSEE